MSSSPYILVLSSIESVVASGYYSRLLHKLSRHLKNMDVDFTVLSPKFAEDEGGKFTTQQLSWLRYCVDQVGGCDIPGEEGERLNPTTSPWQRWNDTIKGTVQIFKQCWQQKPAILQVHQSLYFGLMALPTSLILGIPMVLSFGSSPDDILAGSWIEKMLLIGLMRWSKMIVVGTEEVKSALEKKLFGLTVVLISDVDATALRRSEQEAGANDGQQVTPLHQKYSNYWQETISLWCQVFSDACHDIHIHLSTVESLKEREAKTDEIGSDQSSPQSKAKSGNPIRNRYLSPVINIAYYKTREFRKIIS